MQHEFNTWVYECLQRLAAFHKTWDGIDGGNSVNEDPDGAPIELHLDGDNAALSKSNNSITDGNYTP